MASLLVDKQISYVSCHRVLGRFLMYLSCSSLISISICMLLAACSLDVPSAPPFSVQGSYDAGQDSTVTEQRGFDGMAVGPSDVGGGFDSSRDATMEMSPIPIPMEPSVDAAADSGNSPAPVDFCEEGEYVSDAQCTPCPPGSVNEEGDSPAAGNTQCDAVLCGQDEFVSEHVCQPCPQGTGNPAGGDATGPDTLCTQIIMGCFQPRQAHLGAHLFGYERIVFRGQGDNLEEISTECTDEISLLGGARDLPNLVGDRYTVRWTAVVRVEPAEEIRMRIQLQDNGNESEIRAGQSVFRGVENITLALEAGEHTITIQYANEVLPGAFEGTVRLVDP